MFTGTVNTRLVNALNGKTAKDGGMNLPELKRTLREMFPGDEFIEHFLTLPRNYIERNGHIHMSVTFQPTTSGVFRVLKLCGSSTPAMDEIIRKVRKLSVVEDSADVVVDCVNYLSPPDDTVQSTSVNLDLENLDVFDDNTYDLIIDDVDTFTKVHSLNMNTINWMTRILKPYRFFVLHPNVIDYDPNEFYNILRYDLCKLKTTKSLLKYIGKTNRDLIDEFQEFFSKKPRDYVIRKYIDRLVTKHYRSHISPSMFNIDGARITINVKYKDGIQDAGNNDHEVIGIDYEVFDVEDEEDNEVYMFFYFRNRCC